MVGVGSSRVGVRGANEASESNNTDTLLSSHPSVGAFMIAPPRGLQE